MSCGIYADEAVLDGRVAKHIADHDMRVLDLLNANNALLERARKAETDRDTFYSMLLKADQIVGEGGSARPAPDPTDAREYAEDDKEEGPLQAEDAITATMRERSCTFPEAVERLAAERGLFTHCTPAELGYIAEIDRLRAALAEKKRGE